MKKDLGVIFLTAEQEINLNVGPGDINLNSNVENYVYAKRNQSFKTLKKKKIHITSPYQNQILSVGTNLIPFLEHNDANRSLMGSNMQRQALTLIKAELPLIETGIEKHIAKESQLSLISKESGKIIYSSAEKIILKYPIYKRFSQKKLINEKKIVQLMQKAKWKKKFTLLKIQENLIRILVLNKM